MLQLVISHTASADCTYALLQSGGSFMVVVSVSRWLLMRGCCHVPVSAFLWPPVTGRAPLILNPWLLVAAPLAVILSAVSIVRILWIPALVICVHLTPLMVSSPLWHLPLPAKGDYGQESY